MNRPKVFLVAFGTLFPVYLNTYHGIRSIDPTLLEMARSYGVSGRELFRHVVLPGALPSILVGVRYALGIAWILLIVAETLSATSGIGYLASNAREFLQTDIVVLSILLYALLGKAVDSLAPLAGAPLAAVASLVLPARVTPCRRKETVMKLDDLPSAEHAPIVLSGLTRRFGERVVLDGLNLSIPAGQFLAVVGRLAAARARCCACWPGWIAPTAASCASRRSKACG